MRVLTLRALAQLGWSPAVGERVLAPALAERSKVLGKQRGCSGACSGSWSRPDTSRRTSANSRCSARSSTRTSNAEIEALRGSCPDAEPELEMTERTGMELALALRGERDPIQLLFPGGSLATAERMYRDTPTAKFYNGMMAEVLAALAAARAEGRPLRILELGGGTGGTTCTSRRGCLPRASNTRSPT